MKIRRITSRGMLTLLFSGTMFIIMILTMILLATLFYLLKQVGILDSLAGYVYWFPMLLFSLASVVIGTLISVFFSRFLLRPIHQLMDGMNQLANGYYDTTIDLGKTKVGKEVSDSFNIMAKELIQTEVLRSDFINNLSHEFKTPISSIRGFAKLIQKEKLTVKQKEYAGIIVEESERLTNMATKLLDLTKVEHQSILTDLSTFNLSEQIRNCILLLERKWGKKGIIVNAQFREHFVIGNEDLLKQVWINLLDNAIKFTPEKTGIISLSIKQEIDFLKIYIKNNGPEIPAIHRERLFHKYWQEEASRSIEGAGVGLSIVQKIVSLHKGEVQVESSAKETIFIVCLPIRSVTLPGKDYSLNVSKD